MSSHESHMPNFPKRAQLHRRAQENAAPSDANPTVTDEATPTTVPSATVTSSRIDLSKVPTRTGMIPRVQREDADALRKTEAAPLAPEPSREPTFNEDDDDFLATTGIRSRRIEQEQKRVRRRRRNRKIRAFLIILTVIGLLCGASYLAYQSLADGADHSQTSDDYSGPGGDLVTVTIYKGAVGTDIGQILKEAGVVKSVDAFARAFEANKASNSIRPGTYTLKTKISASDAIAALLDDANRTENTVTVIPGSTVAQVIQRMKDVTDFQQADIEAAVADTQALGLPPEAGGKLEGWLAPGTYELTADSTPQALFKDMVAARIQELDELKIEPKQRQELLIKASILEREVNDDEYLGKVARVIENRLADPNGETQGRLQMDSTVSYAVGRTSGVPTAEELQTDSPYNTYKVKGLPAGPIANPNVKALQAMNAPEEGTWIYFVTVDLDTGETKFSSTLEEHEKAKALLDQYCSTHQSKCFQ